MSATVECALIDLSLFIYLVIYSLFHLHSYSIIMSSPIRDPNVSLEFSHTIASQRIDLVDALQCDYTLLHQSVASTAQNSENFVEETKRVMTEVQEYNSETLKILDQAKEKARSFSPELEVSLTNHCNMISQSHERI